MPNSSHVGMPAARAIELNKIEKSSQSPTLPTNVSKQVLGTEAF